MSAHYTQLPSQSTAQLPLYSSETPSSSSARASPSSPPPAGTQHDDEKGLLGVDGTRLDTTDEEEEEEELETEIKGSHSPRSWSDRLPFRPRTVLFSLLSISILISLFLFFHPSKPFFPSSSPSTTISHDSSSYYSGAPLSIGLFDPSLAQLAPNPLESDATFSDVPFAKVGGSWSALEKGWKPEWAGGKGNHLVETEGGGRYSNGTDWFEKTVILVTIEGMRTDYLSKELTPNLWKLSNEGFRAEALKPVFPTLSAPNHWSILTGLYPSSHGIVSNRFTTKDNKVFDTSLSTANLWDPSFYQGEEPIYRTALASSLKVATLMHPLIPPILSSSSSPKPSPSKPDYWYPSIQKTHPRKKTNKVLQFLDQPSIIKRPQLILTNFEELSIQAEKNGIELVDKDSSWSSSEGEGEGGIEKVLKMIDESFFESLTKGLRERNLEDWVEVVVVGVTGMKNVEEDKVVVLDEILDKETFEKLSRVGEGNSFDGGSSTVIGLNSDTDETSLEDESNLLKQLEIASRDGQGGFNVYTRENLPQEWHFSPRENDRIAPVWLVAKEGWTINTRARLEETEGGKSSSSLKATNGYNSREMDTIFISKGPYTKSILENNENEKDRSIFSNLEVYEFVSNTLGLPIEARALNNGTKGFWE